MIINFYSFLELFITYCKLLIFTRFYWITPLVKFMQQWNQEKNLIREIKRIAKMTSL